MNIFCLHVFMILHHNNAGILYLFEATFSLHDHTYRYALILCHFFFFFAIGMYLYINTWLYNNTLILYADNSLYYETLTLYMLIVCLSADTSLHGETTPLYLICWDLFKTVLSFIIKIKNLIYYKFLIIIFHNYVFL